MDYYVYAIKSNKDGRVYVGLSENPDKRLRQHNQGKTLSTKSWRPWLIIYKKFVGSRIEARKGRKTLEVWIGQRVLENFVQYYSAVAQW